MRFQELIQERISLNTQGMQLRKQLRAGLTELLNRKFKQDLNNLPFSIYAQDPDAPSPNRKPGEQLVEKWIKDYLQMSLGGFMHRQMKSLSGEVVFKEIKDDENGHYDDNTKNIVISIKWLHEMSVSAYAEMLDGFVSSGFETPHCEFYKVMGVLDEVLPTFIHELTHANQFDKSKVSNNYRSYLERNQKKFYDMMRDAGRDLNNNKVYLGSPEEIDAFAQGSAYDLIKEYADEDLEYQIKYISDSIKCLTSQYSRYSAFFQTENPQEQKVVRRFLKRLYQELDSARDDMIANLEKQKKDQHYNAWMDSLDVHDPDFGDKFMMGPPPYKTKPSSKGQ